MGVTGLGVYLKQHYPHVYVKRTLREFRGKRIAVDANNWLYRIMVVAHKKNVDSTDVAVEDPNRNVTLKLWMIAVFEAICTWLSYGITPVFIFDGKAPDRKTETRQERRDIKNDLIEQVNQLRDEMHKFDILDRSPEKVERLRSLLRQCNYVSSTEYELLMNVLIGVGIPVVQAAGESEQLCSMLCIEGKVEAVYSADTDNLAYGCPLVITETTEPYEDPVTRDRYHQVMTVSIGPVLNAIKMTYVQFVDFCILLGCDYNSNIPLIGSKRAFELIKKFGSIDNIPKTDVITEFNSH